MRYKAGIFILHIFIKQNWLFSVYRCLLLDICRSPLKLAIITSPARLASKKSPRILVVGRATSWEVYPYCGFRCAVATRDLFCPGGHLFYGQCTLPTTILQFFGLCQFASWYGPLSAATSYCRISSLATSTGQRFSSEDTAVWDEKMLRSFPNAVHRCWMWRLISFSKSDLPSWIIYPRYLSTASSVKLYWNGHST